VIEKIYHDNVELLMEIFTKPQSAQPVERVKVLADPLLKAISRKSPVSLQDIPQESSHYVPLGHHEGLICLGSTFAEMDTLTREELSRPLEHHRFIVPASMTARSGWTPDTNKVPVDEYEENREEIRWKRSVRTNGNTGHVYAVPFSAPNLTLKQQWEAINALQRRGKVAFIVRVTDSHIEAWFPTSTLKIPETTFRDFAARLGAGPTVKIRCQPYHLPGGTHPRSGKPQSVIFLDPPVLDAMWADAALSPAKRKRSIQASKAKADLNPGRRGRSRGSLTKSQKS
jgi:hypothetical protein